MAEILKDKKSFVMDKDWRNLLCTLEIKQKGELLDGVFKFQCDGEIDDFAGDTALQVILNYFISAFNRDDEKYLETCKKNKENGKKGGRPKKTEQNPTKADGYEKTEPNRTKPKKADNDNDKDNDNEYDYDNDYDLPVSDKPKTEKQTKHKYGIYKNVLLTDTDIEKLKQKFPNDYQEKIENLSEGIELKGYKYKNHYLAILKWENNKINNQNSNKPDISDLSRYDKEYKL